MNNHNGYANTLAGYYVNGECIKNGNDRHCADDGQLIVLVVLIAFNIAMFVHYML